MKILSILNHYLCSQNKPVQTYSTVKDILERLNADFRSFESKSPAEGYRVIFDEKPALQGRLIPMGGLRTTKELSGVPVDTDSSCPFCASDLKVCKVFQDHCRAIYSHSGQLLIIPDTHYVHWFEMPIEQQQKLLEHALAMRKDQVCAAPMELHCGSAGFQTIFHTHFRTGLFKTETLQRR